MKEILTDAAGRAIRYLEGLETRAVAPTAAAMAQLSVLDEPLPAKAGDPAETLRLLDEVGSPATMGMAGPRFFGFVIGGSLPVSLAANWLAGCLATVGAAFAHSSGAKAQMPGRTSWS